MAMDTGVSNSNAASSVTLVPTYYVFFARWTTLFLCLSMPQRTLELQVSRIRSHGSDPTTNGKRAFGILTPLPLRRLHAFCIGNAGSMEMQSTGSLLEFQTSVWDTYEAAVRNMTQSSRVLRKIPIENVGPVVDCLLSRTKIVPLPTLSYHVGSAAFRSQLQLQKVAYLNETRLTDTQYEFALRLLTYMGDYCAKLNNAQPCLVAWYKLQEAGMIPMENCLSTYLYVLGSLDTAQAAEAASQVATFHDALFQPNEKTVTLRIRTKISNHDAAGAEALIDSIPSKGKRGDWRRLRTYLPILTLYCNTGDVSSTLRLYRRMQEIPEVKFEPDTYALLVGSLAVNGCFRLDAEPIEGAVDICGFSISSGPKLFDELATEMAEDILELNEESARVIHGAFVRGFGVSDDSSSHPVALATIDKEVPMESYRAEPGELVASRVAVDAETAMCPRTGAKLGLFKLNQAQRKHVHDTLLEMSAAQYEEFRARMKDLFKDKMEEKGDGDYAVRELSRFSSWLDERHGEPFTAVVDGANVAYFGHFEVHYSQVEKVVEALEAMNERPLVVMPQKYIATYFKLAMGNVQQLDEQSIAAMNRLLQSGNMYAVPAMCLDDYYWMLASVSNQTNASLRTKNNRHVPAQDGQGRFPGVRPMLVTNDRMRDHKLELLEPRLFRRWSNAHIVNYNLTNFCDSEWEERTVQLSPADFFSREIQKNPAPDLGNSSAWHFPVSEWDKVERLCICIPRNL